MDSAVCLHTVPSWLLSKSSPQNLAGSCCLPDKPTTILPNYHVPLFTLFEPCFVAHTLDTLTRPLWLNFLHHHHWPITDLVVHHFPFHLLLPMVLFFRSRPCDVFRFYIFLIFLLHVKKCACFHVTHLHIFILCLECYVLFCCISPCTWPVLFYWLRKSLDQGQSEVIRGKVSWVLCYQRGQDLGALVLCSVYQVIRFPHLSNLAVVPPPCRHSLSL